METIVLEPIKMEPLIQKIKRCPKGTRKNKITNECDKVEEDRKRCPKGSRKNKQTNECVIYENVPIVEEIVPIVEEIAPIVEEIVPIVEETVPIVEETVPIVETIDSCDYDLQKDSSKLNCTNENLYSNECNKFLLKKELIEKNCLSEYPDTDSYLYPNLNDTNFNIKIAEKKEFNDTKYDGIIHKNIKEHADILANAEFELQPHQAFVKNFLSFQTPYNSLLLYHGLGSGKTCSAIGVCEEMRDYMRRTGITKRILIVASENVQDNFKLQLFDERKLKEIDGLWSVKGCIGNKLIKEINPTNMKGIPKEKIIGQIKSLINTYYLFLGYGQLANYIIKIINYSEEIEIKREERKTKVKNDKKDKKDKNEDNKKDIKITLNNRIIRRLRNEFNDRLIVIDEVHNIRMTDDNENKKVAINLEFLVKAAVNMRFLLLSATPMYNSYKEIIWLLNLMNTNDRRGRIETKDVFNPDGSFKKNGQEMLIRKATGYVSFVRGENPYTFPYRVYPDIFAPNQTFPFISYPSYQMNLKKIKDDDKKRILSLYLNKIGNCSNCGNCQYCVYRYIIHNLRNKRFSITTKKGSVRAMPSFSNMESFGYTVLQTPLESLIISYPIKGLKEIVENIPDTKYSEAISEEFSETSNEEDLEPANETSITVDINDLTAVEEPEVEEPELEEPEVEEEIQSAGAVDVKINKNFAIDPRELTGKLGLGRMMDFIDTKSPPEKGSFEYKDSTIKNHGKIFSRKEIGRFSSKIKCILEQIVNNDMVSKGVILIYSQYIDSGLIPMALALEEAGFVRYGEKAKQLFKKPPTKYVDVRTMKPPTNEKDFIPARYTMITGDTRLSPDNDNDVKTITNENNKDGNKVKVILISKAGSEGIDLKFIRQVHILEPWYNMNRIEQITGRAVRNLSHKDLDFENRNVQIFLYGTILSDENREEAADLYVFRVAERKAVQIGKVSRILKESAIDCIINHDQTNFTQEMISQKMGDETITQELSTGLVVKEFKIGDAPNSAACDYMENCNYDCRPDKQIGEINEDTYNEHFIMMNSEKILQRIRMLMKESFFYKKDVLINLIQIPKKYPYTQIYSALTLLIEDNNEFIIDKYGRNGRLVNIGEYYLFQPIELRDRNISIFDRSVPIDYKHDMIKFEINKNIINPIVKQIEQVDNIIGQKIVEQFIKKFATVEEYQNKKVERGDHDWYKYCGLAIRKLVKDYPDIKEYLLEFVIAHMIELLLFEDKLELMNYIYSLDKIKNGSFEWHIKQYFERNNIIAKIMKNNVLKESITFMILYNLNNEKIMILSDTNEWVETNPEQKRKIANSKEAQDSVKFDINKYNKIIGFIGYEKNNSYLIYKTKDMSSSRDRGARCDEAGKEKTIKTLNAIIGETKYTNENTRIQKDADGNLIHDAISHDELCIIQEFILRYNQRIEKDNKIWFIIPEMAIYHKLYTVIVK